MPHNSLIYGGPTDPTAWMPGHVLAQLDLQTIDQTLFECVNGDLGGTWAPASTIVIGGDGLQVVTSASGNFSVIGAAGGIDLYSGSFMMTPAGGIVIGCNTEFDGQNQFDDIVVFSASSFVTVSGNFLIEAIATAQIDCTLVLTGDLGVLGATGLAATTATTLSVGGAVSASATTLATTSGVTTTLAGPVTLSNAVSLTSTLTPSGVGRVRDKQVVLPDADHTLTIGEATVYMVPALGADRLYPLSDTGAGVGDKIRINAIANTTTKNAAVAVGLKTFFLRNETGQAVMVEFEFDGTIWRVNDLVMWDAAING